MPDRNTTEDVDPVPVLSYTGPSPQSMARVVTYKRAGDELTITVPARSLRGQIVWRSFILLLCAGPALALSVTVIDGLLLRQDSSLCCATFPTAIFLFATIYALQRLIYIAREGRNPTKVRLWPGGIEVRASGELWVIDYALPPQQIRDVRVYPGGGRFSGVRPMLILEVITSDDGLYLASIPWRSGEPMIEVEDNVRDLLGLTVAAQGTESNDERVKAKAQQASDRIT